MYLQNNDKRCCYIKYRQNQQIQGPSTLHTIEALKFNHCRYFFYLISCLVFLGIPFIIAFWNKRFKRYCMYDYCKLDEATHFKVRNSDKTYQIVKKCTGRIFINHNQALILPYFTSRYLKYYFHPNRLCFMPVNFDYRSRLNSILSDEQTLISGCTKDEVIELRECFGQCIMQLKSPTVFNLFVREIIQPYFLFLLFSLGLFYYQSYSSYATILLVSYCLSAAISMYQIIKVNNRISEMALYETMIAVRRDNQILKIGSSKLVPGDIVFLDSNLKKIPFDAIVLEGQLVINEVTLTGESIPSLKSQIDPKQYLHNKNLSNCTIYEGTTIMQVNSKKPEGAMVMVIKTGFSTQRGQSIRMVSLSEGKDINFFVQSFKFILIIFFLGIASYSFIAYELYGIISNQQIVVRFLDLITITVQPGIPLSMVIGIGYSLYNLKRCEIYCISPSKVITAGRINYIFFDKTGTLTNDYISLQAIVPAANNTFHQHLTDFDKIPQRILRNIATCHSLIQVNDQYVGDEIEKALFSAASLKFRLDEQSLFTVFSDEITNFEGKVLKRFDFDYQIAMMSVIAIFEGKYYLFTKGSPESIRTIVTKESIPSNYYQKIQDFASKGYRILAVCSKQIQIGDVGLLRNQLQSGMNFDGLYILHNSLKLQTQPTIEQLNDAEIPMAIISGDNPFTSCYMALKSEIVQEHENLYFCTLHENTVKIKQFQNKRVQLNQTTENLLTSNSGETFTCKIQQLCSTAMNISKQVPSAFCITGDLFSLLAPIGSHQFFKLVKVYARTKPHQKTEIVKYFQQRLKYTVCMCGDGCSDCGALKAANVGISLCSENQSSISSAFTSKISNISCVASLIRQCRSGLVTNYSFFNVMAIYSFIEYTTTILCMYYYSRMNNYQFLYVDLGHNFLFILVMGITNAESKISKYRPKQSLFSVYNILSVMIAFAIQLAGHLTLIKLMSTSPFSSQIDYSANGGRKNNMEFLKTQHDFLNDSPEVQSMFLFANFIYIYGTLSFLISKPWKKPFYTNVPLLLLVIVLLAYDTLLCVYPSSRLQQFKLNSTKLPNSPSFDILVWGIGMGIGILIFIMQKIIIQPFFRSKD